MTQSIAIVEDERPIADLIARVLEEQGFRTKRYPSGERFLTALRHEVPSLCLLDLGLPDMDGMSLLSRMREIAPVPVIIMSARHHVTDRIVGLELGADDYVIKPFEPREVVARVRAVLRRREGEPVRGMPPAAQARFAGWRFDSGAMQLTARDGQAVELSSAEARLLQAFLESPQRVLSRDYLLSQIGSEESLDRSIDVRLSRLRKKLQTENSPNDLIRTVYGAGYLLTCAVDWGNP